MIPENNGTFPETMLPAKSGALLKIESISLPTLFPKTSFIANAFRKTTALSLCRLQKVSNMQIRADPFLVRRDNKYLCRVAVQPKAVPPFCVFRLFFRFCIPSLPSRATQSSSAILIIPASQFIASCVRCSCLERVPRFCQPSPSGFQRFVLRDRCTCVHSSETAEGCAVPVRRFQSVPANQKLLQRFSAPICKDRWEVASLFLRPVRRRSQRLFHFLPSFGKRT